MSDYPILEDDVVLKETSFPHSDVVVRHLWVDEDGNTQVSILIQDPGAARRTVTVDDIHERIDEGELVPA